MLMSLVELLYQLESYLATTNTYNNNLIKLSLGYDFINEILIKNIDWFYLKKSLKWSLKNPSLCPLGVTSSNIESILTNEIGKHELASLTTLDYDLFKKLSAKILKLYSTLENTKEWNHILPNFFKNLWLRINPDYLASSFFTLFENWSTANPNDLYDNDRLKTFIKIIYSYESLQSKELEFGVAPLLSVILLRKTKCYKVKNILNCFYTIISFTAENSTNNSKYFLKTSEKIRILFSCNVRELWSFFTLNMTELMEGRWYSFDKATVEKLLDRVEHYRIILCIFTKLVTLQHSEINGDKSINISICNLQFLSTSSVNFFDYLLKQTIFLESQQLKGKFLELIKSLTEFIYALLQIDSTQKNILKKIFNLIVEQDTDAKICITEPKSEDLQFNETGQQSTIKSAITSETSNSGIPIPFQLSNMAKIVFNNLGDNGTQSSVLMDVEDNIPNLGINNSDADEYVISPKAEAGNKGMFRRKDSDLFGTSKFIHVQLFIKALEAQKNKVNNYYGKQQLAILIIDHYNLDSSKSNVLSTGEILVLVPTKYIPEKNEIEIVKDLEKNIDFWVLFEYLVSNADKENYKHIKSILKPILVTLAVIFHFETSKNSTNTKKLYSFSCDLMALVQKNAHCKAGTETKGKLITSKSEESVEFLMELIKIVGMRDVSRILIVIGLGYFVLDLPGSLDMSISLIEYLLMRNINKAQKLLVYFYKNK
ncbi:hypothetical protein BB561_003555 [Smittium simulii]|uniref:Uncharacterized protein n=1 Tax=Smittium simulii TaxID=133385 RepID=A0A2T9YKQ0_9FUNG|nr:hypothetical protein BB561_003555 [Smittium simulii]